MLWKIVIVLTAVYITGVSAVALVLHRTGVVMVSVQDKTAGKQYFAPVHFLMVNTGMQLFPEHRFGSSFQKVYDDKRLVLAAWNELSKCPDADFVQVNTPENHVLITKRGDDLLLDVNAPDKRVQMKIPMAAAAKTLEMILSK
jgi:hypothetical protein